MTWVRKRVIGGRYELYVTEDDELILSPLRSTQPLLFAYLKAPGESKNIAKEISALVGIDVFHIKNFTWRADVPVGVKVYELES